MNLHLARVILLGAALALPASAGAQSPAAAAPAAGKSLYERIGGYDQIAKVIDIFLPKLRTADPRLTTMLSGLADTSRARNRQLIVDQICNLSGGPCLYIGRTMAQSHQGLQIDDDIWKISQRLMAESLDEVKIANPEKAEFVALIETLRPGIVQRPKG